MRVRVRVRVRLRVRVKVRVRIMGWGGVTRTIHMGCQRAFEVRVSIWVNVRAK